MMNVAGFVQDTPNSLFKMEVAYRPQLELNDPVWFSLRTPEFNIEPKAAKVPALKPATAYLFNAFGEALKQNLLGNDINMEFLILSIRVYLIQMITFVVSSPKRLALDNYLKKRNGTSNILNNERSGIPLKFFLQ